ncbi:MAG: Sucraseferredoxin family protein, partial [Pseudonocardiales bacterium]|nr:Sucraseferredoxin family protein [Pseudonocardiales bacterium]
EKRAAAAGMRVQAIRRPGRTRDPAPRRWMVADCRDGSESLRCGRFDADTDLLDLPLDGTAGTLDREPLFLVCAHSKHDTCCALRGRPVAAALADVRPGRVWECSHLGGDRFAANVLVLPAGLLYGRVLPFAAAEFAAAADADEVIGALLRGRVGLPPTAQAALGFAYEHLALRKRTSVRVISTSPIVDGQATVRIGGPHGQLDVTVHVENVAAVGLSCAKPGANHYLSYRPVGVEPVGD